MANEWMASTAGKLLPGSLVYGTAGACLLAGLAIGYLASASRTVPFQASIVAKAVSPSVAENATGGHASSAQSLDAMRRMADQQAAPLLAKLHDDPANSALLTQVGAIYHGHHQFKEATAWYGRAVQADPANAGLRSKLASSLYRSGDVDGALAQLNKALTYDPKDANSLFNLGMIKLQGKGDGKGAVAAWQKLLKTNPKMDAGRRAEVQKLMADVMTTLGNPSGTEGARKP